MFHTLLLVVHTLIAAALVGTILMQRSEGGGLGMGGSPAGLMSARGAADFLTRATAVLAALFILTSIGLAVQASLSRAPRTIDTSLAQPQGAPASAPPLAPGLPTGLGAPAPDAAANNTTAPVPLAE